MQQLKITTTTTSIYYRAWAFIISYGPETPIYLLQPIICSECFDCMTPNIHGQSILQFTRRTRMGIGHARWAPLNLENKQSSTAHKPYATATSYHNNWPSRIPRLLSLRPHQICFFCRSRLLKDRHLTCISGYIRYDSHGNFTIWVAIIDIISRIKKGIVSCIYMHVVLSVQDLFYSSDLVLYCNI